MIQAIIALLILITRVDTVSDALTQCGIDFTKIDLIVMQSQELDPMAVNIELFLQLPAERVEAPSPQTARLAFVGFIKLQDKEPKDWPSFALLTDGHDFWLLLLPRNISYDADVRNCGFFKISLPPRQNNADAA